MVIDPAGYCPTPHRTNCFQMSESLPRACCPLPAASGRRGFRYSAQLNVSETTGAREKFSSSTRRGRRFPQAIIDLGTKNTHIIRRILPSLTDLELKRPSTLSRGAGWWQAASCIMTLAGLYATRNPPHRLSQDHRFTVCKVRWQLQTFQGWLVV